MSIDYSQPEAQQLEVSLFGPGIGESVCIHIGHGKWMIVDSCLNPESKEPASLEYLKNLGLNPSEVIELIVITHWHSDHIKGLAQIVEQCPQAQIVWSEALKENEFLKFYEGIAASPLPEPFEGEADEIKKVLQICLARKANKEDLKFRLASADKRLFSQNGFEVWCLSPSDAAIMQSKLEVSRVLNSQKKLRRRVPMSENLNSVAMLILSPMGNALLGADLEVCTNPSATTGWDAVLTSAAKPQDKARIFKIPHHGSVTGHHDEVWSQMIETNSISMVTEYINSSLPKPSDIERLKKHTTELYRTTLKTKKPGKRDKVVERMVSSIATRRHVYEKKLGHVQLRSNQNSDSVLLGGAACQSF